MGPSDVPDTHLLHLADFSFSLFFLFFLLSNLILSPLLTITLSESAKV